MGTTASAAAGAEPADRSAFHLPGHPLPALVELASTDEQERKVDLFMTSLSRPILLTTFAARGAPQLLALKEHLAQLRAYSPQLAVYGLSTHTPAEQSQLARELSLPFALLSDQHGELTRQLELPSDCAGGAASTADTPMQYALRRGTMLLKEGQVTRLDYGITDPRDMGHRALELLHRDPS